MGCAAAMSRAAKALGVEQAEGEHIRITVSAAMWGIVQVDFYAGCSGLDSKGMCDMFFRVGFCEFGFKMLYVHHYGRLL